MNIIASYLNHSTIVKDIGFYLIISIFLSSLYEKITDYNGLVKLVNLKKLPFSNIAPISAIVMLILGTSLSSLAYNKKINRKYGFIGIDTLLVFTIIATYYFHNIFINPKQKYNFQKNISIIGALLYVRNTI